jgi:hypothetical protein
MDDMFRNSDKNEFHKCMRMLESSPAAAATGSAKLFKDLFGFFLDYTDSMLGVKTSVKGKFAEALSDGAQDLKNIMLTVRSYPEGFDDFIKADMKNLGSKSRFMKDEERSISISARVVELAINIFLHKKNYIYVSKRIYRECKVNFSNSGAIYENIYLANKSDIFGLLIFMDDLGFLMEIPTKDKSKNRFLPLTFMEVAKACDDDEKEEGKSVKNAMRIIFSHISDCGGGMVFKDVAKDIGLGGLHIPVPINDFIHHGTRKEALEKILGHSLPPVANKRPIQHTFYAAKLCKYIGDANEHQKLYCASADVSVHCNQYCRPIATNAKAFLVYYIANKLGINLRPYYEDYDYEETYYILRDYANMAIAVRDIILTRSSLGGYKKEHDRVHAKYLKKSAKKNNFKIKKDSPYCNLLQGNYRLIKTMAELLEEAAEMHHCVDLYADRIRSGSIAIYKTTYYGQRYTVEIKRNRGKQGYAVGQIRGKYNEAPPAELVSETKRLLAENLLRIRASKPSSQ